MIVQFLVLSIIPQRSSLNKKRGAQPRFSPFDYLSFDNKKELLKTPENDIFKNSFC
jgi:hypothetical protein